MSSFLRISKIAISLAPFSHLVAAIPTVRQETVRDRAKLGSWSDLIELPVIPVAAYVVPAFPEASKVLFFSSWGNDTFGGEGGMTQFAELDYLTYVGPFGVQNFYREVMMMLTVRLGVHSGNVSHRTVANTKHDMFCPAISTLEDGRILIQGGSDASNTTFYDPATDEFTTGPELTTPRGYQSSTTLSDGRVFTIGGAYSAPIEGKDGEVYDPVTDVWTALPDARVEPMLTTDFEGIWREDNHAWLVGWKNASIFQAGPSKSQNWYGANNNGSQTPAGTRDDDDAMCGVFVMYEPGKILSAGGSPDYTESNATARAHITTIDAPDTNATVERVADMAFPRGFANAVVLPDGQVLVTGGQKRSVVFTDTDSVLEAEMFDPATGNWTTLAAEEFGRNYHSVSTLLPDGTVFSGGGGLCYVKAGVGNARAESCDDAVDHPNGQIFSPPYLFNADGSDATRPVIANVTSTTIKVGGELKATVNAADAELVLVRLGTVTHSVNTDQRRIPLTTTFVGQEYTATLEADSGILLPGHYYLFAIAAGVPSVAKTVQITL
ncbi:unnamed protein product [Discula destructiva]